MSSPYGPDPRSLAESLSELAALRGLARSGGDRQLAEIWDSVAGPEVALRTRVMGIKRGVLQVGVDNAPLLSELTAFRQADFLKSLQTRHADLKIRGIKFVLRGGMKQKS
jgi:predicted nucleic acid-binding Zn ribbon protein